jgi:hypothetical protein
MNAYNIKEMEDGRRRWKMAKRWKMGDGGLTFR